MFAKLFGDIALLSGKASTSRLHSKKHLLLKYHIKGEKIHWMAAIIQHSQKRWVA